MIEETNGKTEEVDPYLEAAKGAGRIQAEQDDRQLAMMCHLLGLITSVFVPMVFVLSKKGDSDFLTHHETQSLNFQITMILAMTLAIWLDFNVFEHAYLIPVVLISDIILCITAAIRANESILYVYPLSIPFLKPRKTDRPHA
ncbi:MAG: DUF4870 domain-containing protein [Victivallales bacterium]|nr:DUF4870 domain-containing protein [Victivallales bacterium]